MVRGVFFILVKEFCIEGAPQGKGRPRFTRKGKPYTPAKTKAWEKYIRECYEQQCGSFNFDKRSLAIEVYAYVKPLSKYRKKDFLAALKNLFSPTSRPDADNILKGVLDALNNIAYKDDRYIYSLYIIKQFSENPRIEVKITARDEIAPTY